VTSCGSSSTVMTWRKFVCVYLRVDGVFFLRLVSYKDASSRVQTFLYLSS
jgi:hypothetical protein